MRQLDLGEQRKKQLLTEGAQILVKSISVTREREKQEKGKNLASNDNPTMATNVMSLTELTERNRIGQREHEVDDEPMKIVETDRNEKTDLSIHGAVINRATLSQPRTVNEDSKIVNSPLLIPIASQLSDSNSTKSLIEPPIPNESPISIDPRFYVCTSFETAISQKTTLVVGEEVEQTEIILPHASLRSNASLNSIVPSSSASSRSSRYYDYCLSEGEFDVALSCSQTSNDVAKMKRSNEISRIETDTSFDEKAFLHVQESLNLTPDDDIMMSPA